MSEHRAQVDELLAGYRRSRDELADVHQRLASISESASSVDGSVTATVGPRGTLVGLVITEDAYRRYLPSALAEQIVQVTAAATVRALSGAGEVLVPALPPGTDPQALLWGTADLDGADIAPATDDESFEHRTFVEDVR